jgi:hypothetical protein
MSASSLLAMQAQNIRYGILASTLSGILQSSQSLDDDAMEKVRQGVDFVEDVIRGAKAISGSPYSALTSEKSIEALGYAIEPISALHEAITQDEDLVLIFSDICQYLTTITETRNSSSAVNIQDQSKRHRAIVFFDALASHLLAELSAARMQETVRPLR